MSTNETVSGTVTVQGELEVDYGRGVIYFHTKQPGVAALWGAPTILRVCQVKLDTYLTPIDIVACNSPSEHSNGAES